MEYIQWQPAFDLDRGDIDRQHKELLRILNETYGLMMSFADPGLFYRKLQELREYARIHFDFEEELMERAGYPELRAHREKHGDFIDSLGNLEKKLRKGKKSAPAEVFVFLRDWLLEHIQVADRAYGPYILTP